jgi:integrase
VDDSGRPNEGPQKGQGRRTAFRPAVTGRLAPLETRANVCTGDAVFAAPSGSPLSYNSFAVAPKKAGIDAGTPHSWRSVFRDRCGEKDRVDWDLAEAALAHKLPKVQGSYRRMTAIEPRRPVMEAYARRLTGEGANVIPFPAIRS